MLALSLSRSLECGGESAASMTTNERTNARAETPDGRREKINSVAPEAEKESVLHVSVCTVRIQCNGRKNARCRVYVIRAQGT